MAKLITILPKSEYEEVHLLILKHPYTPNQHLEKTYCSENITPNEAQALARNPRLIEKGLIYIYPHLTAELQQDLVEHPNAGKVVLGRLANDGKSKLVQQLAQYKLDTPINLHSVSQNDELQDEIDEI